MNLARWLARVAALGLFVAGTIATAVRFGVVTALGAAGGTIIYVIALSERIWPERAASTPVVQVHAADSARATEGVVIQTTAAITAVSTMTANVVRSIAPGVGGGSAILGFRADVMDRLARGDYPAVDRSLYRH